MIYRFVSLLRHKKGATFFEEYERGIISIKISVLKSEGLNLGVEPPRANKLSSLKSLHTQSLFTWCY